MTDQQKIVTNNKMIQLKKPPSAGDIIKLAIINRICYSINESTVYNPDKNGSKKDKFNEMLIFAGDVTHGSELDKNITKIESEIKHSQAIAITSIDKKSLYISAAGSDDIMDFVSNFNIQQVSPVLANTQISPVLTNTHVPPVVANECPSGILFHNGFNTQALGFYNHFKVIVSDFLKNGGEFIYLTGHSTGGCLVSILAFYLHNDFNFCNFKVVTFGSPIFTNEEGKKWFESIDYTRLYTKKDPVPNMTYQNYIQISKVQILIKNSKLNIIIDKTSEDDISCFALMINVFYHRKFDLKFHSIDIYIDKLEKLI